MNEYKKLINSLIKSGYLKTKSIINAFISTDRKLFSQKLLVIMEKYLPMK